MAELSLEDLKASYFGYLKKHLEIMGDPNHKTVQEHLKQLQHYPNAEDECLEVTFHAAETDRFEVPETFRYEDINDLSHPLLIQGKKLIGVSETNHEDEIIDLSDYRYHHAIVFKDCIIGGNHPNFKTIFKNAAHTAYADIFERVFFDNCTFTDETEFTSLHLMRGLRFHNCIFQKNVSMANLDSGDERLAKEYPSYNSTIRINKCLFHANLNLNNIGVRDCFEVENGCIYGRLKITCLTAKKLILKETFITHVTSLQNIESIFFGDIRKDVLKKPDETLHHVISQKETTFTSIIRDVEVHSFSIINSYFGAEKGLPFSLNLYNIVGFEDCTIRGCFFRKNSFIRKLKGHCFSFEENKIEDDLYLYNISLRGDNHYLLHNINNDRGTPWKKCLQEFQKYCHEACFENNAFENIEEKFKADKQNNTLILFCNIRTSDQALLSLINIGEKENAGNIALVFLDNDLTHGSVHIKNFDLKYFRVDEITSKKAVQYSDCKLAEYQEDIFTVIDVFRQNIIQKDNCYGCYDITEEDVFPLQKQNTDRKDRSAYASITILIASILLYAYSPFVPFSNAVYNLICFIILLIIYNIVSCLSLRKAWHFMIPKEGIISSCKSEKLVLILFVIVIIILTILAESNPNIFPDTLPWALIIFYGFWFIKDYFNWYPNQHDTSPFIVPDKDKDKDKAAAYCKQQRELFSHLKERAFEAHRFAESRHYHLLELRWLRSYYQNKKGLRGFFSWFFLAVYDVTSGIGIAIVRPLTSSFLSFLLFSIIFYVSFLIQNDNIQNLNSFTVQNKNPQDQWQEVIWKNSKEISVIDSFTFAKVPSLIASLILMEDGDETCSPPNKRSDSDLTRFTKPFCFQGHPLVRKTFKHYLAMIIIFQTLLQLFFALQILSAIRHKAIHYTN